MSRSKLYTVKFQPDPIDKKGWSVIDFNNCCTQDGGWYLNMGWGVESLIDNNPGTQWLCRWDVKEPLPYYFVFDMGKEYTLFRFDLLTLLHQQDTFGQAHRKPVM